MFKPSILKRFSKQVPELSDALKAVKMKHTPTLKPPFEMLVRSVTYQQLAYPAAKAIHDRLLKLVGKLTPTRILTKSEEELRSVGLSRQKASYIHNIAKAFKRGGFLYKYRTPESLEDMPSEEISTLFSQIKGVGEWTVQMYLIFSLGRIDVVSTKDLGVRKGVQKLYNLEEIPTPKQVKEIAKKWHPLETVGTYLAWRVMDEG